MNSFSTTSSVIDDFIIPPPPQFTSESAATPDAKLHFFAQNKSLQKSSTTIFPSSNVIGLPQFPEPMRMRKSTADLPKSLPIGQMTEPPKKPCCSCMDRMLKSIKLRLRPKKKADMRDKVDNDIQRPLVAKITPPRPISKPYTRPFLMKQLKNTAIDIDTFMESLEAQNNDLNEEPPVYTYYFNEFVFSRL